MTQQNQIQKRTKGKNNTAYKLIDMYKTYLKDNPKGSDFYVDKNTYFKLNKILFEKMMNNVLIEGKEVKIPYNLGSLSVIKVKTPLNRLKPDYDLSNKEGMIIYQLNDHSNGYIFRFRWKKMSAIFINKRYYSFIPTRSRKRELARLIKSGEQDYFKI